MSIDGQDFRTRNTAGEVIDQILSAEILGGLRVIEGRSFKRTGRANSFANDPFASCSAAKNSRQRPRRRNSGQRFQSSIGNLRGDGGPRYVLVETLNTPPVRQQTNQFTKCRCVQEGTIVRRYSRPAVPPALSGVGATLTTARRVRRTRG